MNFNQFVIRNTIRNKRLYVAYFLSTLFSVMTFFTFATLAYHPDLVSKIEGTGGTKATAVNQGMMGAAVIIFIFSFIFVLYSMDVFLQSRKKEFGLLMMQGMSPNQLKRMIFIENLVIGVFSTLFGILFGLVFAQLIQWFARLTLHFNLSMYFPTKAVGITLISFLLLFLVISVLVQFMIPKAKLQDLLKADESGKGELKVSIVKSLLGFILLATGYFIALKVTGVQVIAAMLPVIVIVIIGTYFFFNQFTVFMVQRLKKNQKLFWKKTNLVVFSDLSFRMKDNARSFFFVSIVSTVAFAAIGTLYGFKAMTTQVFDLDPYEYAIPQNNERSQGMEEAVVKAFKENKVPYEKVNLTTYEFYPTQDNPTTFIPVSEFNKLAKLVGEKTITVAKGQGVDVYPDFAGAADNDFKPSTVDADGNTIQISKMIKSNVLPSMVRGYVVNDEDVAGLTPEKTVLFYTPKADSQKLYVIGEKMAENYPMFISQGFLKEATLRGNNALFFVGTFIGIVFFVSAGSFLYFRLYSDMAEDVKKFTMIYKLGLSPREMKKMVYQQVGILFFTPIVVSLLHGAVALTAMYHAAGGTLQKEAYYVLIAFLVIQIIYYLVARTFYYKGVEKKVMAI